MPDRRSQKTLAVFLGWLLPLFWCMGMVYPVNGEFSGKSYEIVDLEVKLNSKSQGEVIPEEKEQQEKVQAEKVQEMVQQKDEIKQEVISQQEKKPLPELPQTRLITIQPGESLSVLAQRYKTSVAELVKINGISQPNKIVSGQKIFVPVSDSTVYAQNFSSISRGRVPITEEELELLARVIHGEARGEDFIGQVAVAAVVLNRVQDRGFPNTIREVIYQQNAFTAVNDKQINLEPNETAYRAALAAIMGEDPTGGAIYYYNPKIATDRWIKTRPVIKTIGNHTFSI